MGRRGGRERTLTWFSSCFTSSASDVSTSSATSPDPRRRSFRAKPASPFAPAGAPLESSLRFTVVDRPSIEGPSAPGAGAIGVYSSILFSEMARARARNCARRNPNCAYGYLA